MQDNVSKTLFEAVLHPHRSLSRKGVIIAISVMLAGSAFTTSLMFLLGAWPVIGFNGVEIALALFLFRLNIRAARARETIILTSEELQHSHTNIKGQTQTTILPPYWLKIVIEERHGRTPALLLAARNIRREIGMSLGESEKRDLAQALAAALTAWRTPVFANSQLD